MSLLAEGAAAPVEGAPAGAPPVGTPPATPPVEGAPATPPATPPVDGAKPPEAQAVPEKYEFKLPEGIAPDAAEKFSAIAKDLKLPQAEAQKLVDLALARDNAAREAQAAEYNKLRGEWVSEIKTDKDFGGDKFGETIERAKRTLTKFADPTFREFLDQSGYGDNPGLIRMLAKMDKAIGEDMIVDGAPAGSTRSAAEVIYPSSGK